MIGRQPFYGRFATETLALPENRAALADLIGQWIDRFHHSKGLKYTVLDMDSSVSPTHPDQEGTAWNGHFDCTCWAWFEDQVGLGGKNGTRYPLKPAYRATRQEVGCRDWAWPPYETVNRRWTALPAARRRTLDLGERTASASLTQYQPCTVDTLNAMQHVELDRRECGMTVRFRDGVIGCPWVTPIMGRASAKVVGCSISPSENAEAVAVAITTVCKDRSLPVLTLTDNGAAINSRCMTGGLRPRYRTEQQRGTD